MTVCLINLISFPVARCSWWSSSSSPYAGFQDSSSTLSSKFLSFIFVIFSSLNNLRHTWQVGGSYISQHWVLHGHTLPLLLSGIIDMYLSFITLDWIGYLQIAKLLPFIHAMMNPIIYRCETIFFTCSKVVFDLGPSHIYYLSWGLRANWLPKINSHYGTNQKSRAILNLWFSMTSGLRK